MSDFPNVTFTGVLVHKKNHVYFSSVSDELSRQNIDHAAILRWVDAKWAHKTVTVAVRGMCVQEGVKTTLLNMGINGKIVEFTFPGENVEHVDPSKSGPSDLVHLRCMARIGGHVYVAGMARHVYRRDGANRWTAIDKEVFVPREAREKAVGFNAIDGLREDSIYAVGYGGEIWHYDGNTWKQDSSPTNLTLNCVKCLPDGSVYICGMSGSVLRGSFGRWEVIQHDVTENDFWGIAYFREHVCVSNYDGIFKIDDGEMTQVRMNLPSTIGFDSMDGLSEDAICAAGYGGEIWWFDGKSWKQEASPTNVGLNGVRCTPSGEVYICGMSGILLRGGPGRWEVIKQEETVDDFWGIVYFRDHLYVANNKGVFRLSGDRLALVEMKLSRAVTTSYLDAHDGVLISVGDKDVVSTTDGIHWTHLVGPE